MSLTKRTTQIPVGGGVEEGASDVLFDAPLVRSATNTQIQKTGSIGKRYGETTLPAGLPSTSIYGEHSTIAEHEKRAIVLTQLGAYMHDPARGTWATAGAVQPRPSQVKTDPLGRANNSLTQPEIALVTVGGKTVACVVWHDVETYEGFYLWAEVPADGSALRALSGPSMFPGPRNMALSIRLATIGTTVYAIAGDDDAVTDIWCSKADAAATYNFSTPISVSPGWGLSATPVALLSDNSAALWAVLEESGGGYSIRKLNTSFAETALQVVAGARALDAIRYGSTIVVIKGDGSIDDCADSLAGPPTNRPLVAVNAATGPLYTNTSRATLCEAGAGTFFCAWERMGSATPVLDQGVVIAEVSAGYALEQSGTVGTIRLAGRAAYSATDGVPLLPVIDSINETIWRMGYVGRPTEDEHGLYTLSEVCRFGQDVTSRMGTARTFTVSNVANSHAAPVVPSLVRDAVTGQWLLPYVVLSDAVVSYLLTGKSGIDLLRLETADAPALRTSSAQGLRLFAGGAGCSYVDGITHAEVTPPPIGLIDAPALAFDDPGISYLGSLAEGTFYFALAPRWRDARGNLHRGAPLHTFGACPWDQVVGVPDDGARRFRFPRPFPASIRGERGGRYEVEVYAAIAEAGPYYLMDVKTPEPHPTHLGVDYILISLDSGHVINPAQITDGIDYIAHSGNPAAAAASWVKRWTETSELVHVPPPPAIDMCSTQERLWLLSAEAGRLDLLPSKRLVDGLAPEFPTALRVRVPDEGGEAVAVAALNDKVVVFKERLIYVVFGDPGDNTGSGSTVQTPRLVQGDVGCREAQSVVEGPFGVVFRSGAGGFHLLGPGLDVTRLPALEDTLGDYVVTSGVLAADRKEVRWSITTGSKTGKTLVWDYEQNAWMTHEFSAATAHACTVDGDYTRLVYQGSVRQERATWATSDTHEMLLTSAWVKLAGLQGFKRVWKTIFKFRRDLTHGSAGVTIRIGYNYDSDTWVDVRTWTATELGTLQIALGSDTFDLVVHHTRQKIEAFRFQIEEVDPGGQTPVGGSGLTLLGVACEWGRRQGSGAQTTGATQRK